MCSCDKITAIPYARCDIDSSDLECLCDICEELKPPLDVDVTFSWDMGNMTKRSICSAVKNTMGS